jgi:hypothetical protein
MPATHDFDPDAMTDDERIAKRRFEAAFAFESQPQPVTVHCAACRVGIKHTH